MSNEFFTRDPDKSDAALHGAILDNPEADAALAARAIERAIARGLTRDEAEALYGLREAAPE